MFPWFDCPHLTAAAWLLHKVQSGGKARACRDTQVQKNPRWCSRPPGCTGGSGFGPWTEAELGGGCVSPLPPLGNIRGCRVFKGVCVITMAFVATHACFHVEAQPNPASCRGKDEASGWLLARRWQQREEPTGSHLRFSGDTWCVYNTPMTQSLTV